MCSMRATSALAIAAGLISTSPFWALATSITACTDDTGVAAWGECTKISCCSTPGFRCYQKNRYYAQCRDVCRRGIDYSEGRQDWLPWSCRVLEPATGLRASPKGTKAMAPSLRSSMSKTSTTTATATATETTTVVPKYRPKDSRLLHPSSAEVLSFYTYRVQNDQNYPPENQNTANLAGALWYLHNEIVIKPGHRRYGKTRIQRFRVTTKAPQPLWEAGMNFGVRYAFDAGQCTGPFDCQEQFEKYGYFVGCNKVMDFPTSQWNGMVFYKDALWYSLPGACNSMKYFEHNAACVLNEPGGACRNVTGAGNCTFSYENAGEISINELEGIQDFEAFAAAGGWEYDVRTDRGVGMTFWDDKYNETACDERLERAEELFAQRYPGAPTVSELPDTPCDFNVSRFYSGGFPNLSAAI